MTCQMRSSRGSLLENRPDALEGIEHFHDLLDPDLGAALDQANRKIAEGKRVAADPALTSRAANIEVVARGLEFRVAVGLDFQDRVGLHDSRTMQHQFAPRFHGVDVARGGGGAFGFDGKRNLRFPQKGNRARMEDRPDVGVRRVDRHGMRQAC